MKRSRVCVSDTSRGVARREKASLPRTWTEEKAAIVIERIRFNAFRETAAQAAGIPKATFYNWLTAAKADDCHPRLREWAEELERVEAEAESNLLATVNFHAAKSWQAAAWIAERKWPERYGRPYRPEIRENPKDLPDDELLGRLLDGLLNTEKGQEMVRQKLTLIEGGKK